MFSTVGGNINKKAESSSLILGMVYLVGPGVVEITFCAGNLPLWTGRSEDH